MTPEFGAASQLEKIDMLDFADVVAINKFERRGAEDALRDVRRQLVRNREEFGATWEDMPVFGTIRRAFNDDGVTALYQHLRGVLAEDGLAVGEGRLPRTDRRTSAPHAAVIPPGQVRYLAEIAETVRGYHAATDRRPSPPRGSASTCAPPASWSATRSTRPSTAAEKALPAADAELLDGWPQTVEDYSGDELVVRVRDRSCTRRSPASRCRAAGSRRVALPRYTDDGELLRFLRGENLPGRFPFTAGVFPFKREDEDPARMFAGEGDAFRTNRRFQLLWPRAPRDPAVDRVRLGHAVRLRSRRAPRHLRQGRQLRRVDRDARRHEGAVRRLRPVRPDHVGVDDDQRAGADDPRHVPQHRDRPAARRFRDEEGRDPDDAEREELPPTRWPTCAAPCRPTSSRRTRARTPASSPPSSRSRMMADIQEWFVAHEVRNFYSVSISGYHIAEAGANPISQLAFTLANGFTYVEATSPAA